MPLREASGGFKTETVAEDAHTSLVLHSFGYASVYLPTPLAAGLATESYRGYVQQKCDGREGMAQIHAGSTCPLFNAGSRIPQRVRLLQRDAALLSLGIPRLIADSCAAELPPVRHSSVEGGCCGGRGIRILPHVALSMIANSIISKNYRSLVLRRCV